MAIAAMPMIIWIVMYNIFLDFISFLSVKQYSLSFIIMDRNKMVKYISAIDTSKTNKAGNVTVKTDAEGNKICLR